MKTITIPKKFGFPTLDITVNGKEYTVKSGEEITVEDHVADVIEHAIALEPKPKRYLSKLAQRAEGSLVEITAEDLEGVVAIATYAFHDLKNLQDVTIPDSVTAIGDAAFFACSNLKSVRFGTHSKLDMGNSIFDWCGNLKSVYLPETPPTLADINAFANIKSTCNFYCKTQASLDSYKAAEIWSTLAETYTFKVEE